MVQDIRNGKFGVRKYEPRIKGSQALESRKKTKILAHFLPQQMLETCNRKGLNLNAHELIAVLPARKISMTSEGSRTLCQIPNDRMKYAPPFCRFDLLPTVNIKLFEICAGVNVDPEVSEDLTWNRRVITRFDTCFSLVLQT